jgi:Fe-S cluster assembly iron-binding protein IscA
MVRVSNRAVALCEEIRRNQEIPESHGIRIFGEDNELGGMDIRLAFTDDSGVADLHLEEHGAQFFLGPDVAEPREDSVIRRCRARSAAVDPSPRLADCPTVHQHRRPGSPPGATGTGSW